jgi:hypothetical protein
MHSKLVVVTLSLAIIFSLKASAEYETKSVFSDDYKCTAEEKGGFSHTSTEHKLVFFHPDEEFFLMHISNIPKEAIFEMQGKLGVENRNNDEDLIRESVERRDMTQRIVGDNYYTAEEGSYYIREPDQDPKAETTYMQGKCTSLKSAEISSITCFENSQGKTFNFVIDTGRFSYSYAGSWEHKHENEYYGDSSVVAFGTCKKYFN